MIHLLANIYTKNSLKTTTGVLLDLMFFPVYIQSQPSIPLLWVLLKLLFAFHRFILNNNIRKKKRPTSSSAKTGFLSAMQKERTDRENWATRTWQLLPFLRSWCSCLLPWSSAFVRVSCNCCSFSWFWRCVIRSWARRSCISESKLFRSEEKRCSTTICLCSSWKWSNSY